MSNTIWIIIGLGCLCLVTILAAIVQCWMIFWMLVIGNTALYLIVFTD